MGTSFVSPSRPKPGHGFEQVRGSVFFSMHKSQFNAGGTWQGKFAEHGPVLKLILSGRLPPEFDDRRIMRAAIWWNFQIACHEKGMLSPERIGLMKTIARGFLNNAPKLRLSLSGDVKEYSPKPRRDYYWFAKKFADCIRFPEGPGNRLWLEVLRERHRYGKLDNTQERLVNFIYPHYFTEKAFMHEKCIQFEKKLKSRLADLKNQTNKNWLHNLASLARQGRIHPEYIKIMDKYGLLAYERQHPAHPPAIPAPADSGQK